MGYHTPFSEVRVLAVSVARSVYDVAFHNPKNVSERVYFKQNTQMWLSIKNVIVIIVTISLYHSLATIAVAVQTFETTSVPNPQPTVKYE